MPIYEYVCRACQHRFEFLVLASTTPACPACQSADLERQLSGFAVTTSQISGARVKRARDGARASRDNKDKSIADTEQVKKQIEHLREH